MRLPRAKTILLGISCALVLGGAAYSAPYGAGLYGDNIPYGDETSMSIAVVGDVDLQIAPTADGATATADVEITVTTTNTEGYILAVKADNSALMLESGLDSIPAHTGTLDNPAPFGSGQGSTAWGFNLDGGPNYAGITTNNEVIRATHGINPTGELTTVTYAAHVTIEKFPGSYQGAILYTLIAPTP